MNSIRKTTALLAAFVVTLASLTAVTLSPALADPAPASTASVTATPTASPPPTTTAPATPSPGPTGTTAPPATAESLTNPEPLFTEVYGGSNPTSSQGHGAEEHGPKGAEQHTAATEAYSLARSGDIKVKLVMVQLADKKAAISEAAARAAIQTSSAYWQAMSNGRLSMSVATVENRSSTATSTQSYSAMMNTIAGEIGWVPSSYTALVVFVSSPTLSAGAYGAGWSYNGTSGRVLMPLPATLTKSVLTHEFGHVLGLMHASRLRCGNGAVDTASTANGSFANSTCSIEEYKDNLDLMGVSQTSQPVVSSPIYEFGGFGSGNEIRNLGKAVGKNFYQLKAWGSADDYRGLKFTDPVSGETYYVELRLPVGNDSVTAVNGNRGVKVVQGIGAGSIALQPSTTTFIGLYSSNQTWQAGQTFTTHAGTRVTIDWISSSAAGITIESTATTAAKAIESVASTTTSLGSATSGVICGLRNSGCYQAFQYGSIHYAPGIGAYATAGAIRTAWAAQGFETGKLGYPAGNEVCGLTGGGCYQAFENGSIHYAPGVGAYATVGAIRATWSALSFETGKLGYPTGNEVCGLTGGGCYQSFQKGTIHYAPGVGAFATWGAIRDTWGKLGFEKSKLGYPVAHESCGLTGGGCHQTFQNGTIHYATGVGAFATWGAIRDTWGKLGSEKSALGYPVAHETCGLTGGGCAQAFQKGAIHYAPGIGAYATWGPIRTTWAALSFERGKLGYPTSNVNCGLPGSGCYQLFQGGTVHSSPGSGTYATWGAIRDTWGAQGFERGKLGYPTGNEICGLTGGGCSQAFQNGAIHYSPGLGAHATGGPTLATWRGLASEKGKLGYPASGEVCGLPGGGCYQQFQGGTIHSAPGVGAFATWGAIRGTWGALGFERGKLGYPVSNEICGLINGGCYQAFQGGTIHYAPAVGASATWGAIRNTWGALGFERGKLGYPAGNEVCGLAGGGCSQKFQNGSINWSPVHGISVVP
ncbi:MAG TPA: M43 family zinc metalloprotease [Arthrobacter sp.]|nr:M43 family zinc metalloprotease [Arthrobacter sp.]